MNVSKMSKKERRAFLREKILAVQDKKMHSRMYDNLAVFPDGMLVKLRDRLTDCTNIAQAGRVQMLRDLKIDGNPVPPPHDNKN